MTDTMQPRESLGVGVLIGESFSLVFGNLGSMLPIALIPAVIGIVINLLTIGPAGLNSTLALTDPTAYAEATSGLSGIALVLMSVLGLLLWAFASAALTQAAYDAKLDGAARFGPALATGLQRLIPVILVFLIAGICAYVGLIALVLPGLYITAMWFVIIPAVVIERVGLRALGRSASLTKGYRWPMVGLVVLFILIYLAISIVSGALQFALAGLGSVGLIAMAITTALVTAIAYCLGGAIAALAYARLREIKEGTTMQSLVEVFR